MKKIILLIIGISVLLVGISKVPLADSIMLGPYDFHPKEKDTVYSRNGLHMYLDPTSTSYEFFAPVHLPQDAIITSVVVFYYDAAAPEDLNITLEKVNKYNKAETTMADWSTSGQTFSDQIHKISPITGGNKVDNGGYIYFVTAFFSDSSAETTLKLYSVKIIYSTT
jgi:hypothetical protein